MSGSAGGGVELVFDELAYGTAAESESAVKLWIDRHQKCFGQFINGSWSKTDGRSTSNVKKPTTDEVLAAIQQATAEDISFASENSRQAFQTWSTLSPHTRAQHLYSIARNLQKHQSLVAVVEAVSTGQPTRETRGLSVPAAIRHFYHHAGWAGLMNDEMKGWKPYGVVAVIVPVWMPIMQAAGRVAAALAMGNTVLLVPCSFSPLSTLLLADICSQAGLPPGVLNVLSLSDVLSLAANNLVDKFVFAGQAKVGKRLRELTAGNGQGLSMELRGRSVAIVLEGADLDSAVEGIVEAAWFNSGQTFFSGSRLLVQECVFKTFLDKLKVRMAKLTGGDNLDKNHDQGALCCGNMFTHVSDIVDRAKSSGAEVFSAYTPKQPFYPPTIVTNVQTSSEIYLDEGVGPAVVVLPFRTAKEGVALANHTPFGLSASVWTEDLTVALEVASMLQTTTVWVNGHHIYDAAAGTGGCKSSGFGRTGGREGLYEYVRPSWQPRHISLGDVDKKFGSSSTSDMLPGASVANPGVDKTYKMFYGGAQKRPDSGASKPVLGAEGSVVSYVPDAGKKDVRNAVEAALKAAGGWAKKEGHGRAQIMYYMAENLEARKQEFVKLLSSMTTKDDSANEKEVDMSVQRLFYWAAYCDKFGGEVDETPFYGLTVKKQGSVGVIGAVCPEECPLLGFVSLIAPALARGNAIIAVPSEKCPLTALAFSQILETSDVPAGVVNILTGSNDVLTRSLADHHDVSSVWYFGSEAGSRYVEFASAGNMKRTWVNYGQPRDFTREDQGQGQEFLYQASASKTIWLPMGTIFAN